MCSYYWWRDHSKWYRIGDDCLHLSMQSRWQGSWQGGHHDGTRTGPSIHLLAAIECNMLSLMDYGELGGEASLSSSWSCSCHATQGWQGSWPGRHHDETRTGPSIHLLTAIECNMLSLMDYGELGSEESNTRTDPQRPPLGCTQECNTKSCLNASGSPVHLLLVLGRAVTASHQIGWWELYWIR